MPDGNVEDLRKGVQNLNFAISAFEVQRTLGIKQPINPESIKQVLRTIGQLNSYTYL